MADDKELHQLYREVRDHDPEVWELACHRLGERASTEQKAYSAMCDLLTSPLPELRLKGLIALRTMAPAKPDEVLIFLTQRIDEARQDCDPVLLDTAFFVFTTLPNGVGQTLVKGYLNDPSEAVRAAAAAALPFWPTWEPGTYLKLAQDPSIEVRAGLLAALAEMDDSPDRTAALTWLKDHPEPLLSALLQDLLEPLEQDPPRAMVPLLDGAQAAQLLRSPHPTPQQAARFEEFLLSDPSSGLKILRSSLDKRGGQTLLRQLPDLCRDRCLATVFRVWSRVLEPGEEPTPMLMLRALGVLESMPEEEALSPLKEFLKSCVEAADCDSSEALATWSYSWQVSSIAHSVWSPPTEKGLVLATEAPRWLSRLAEVGSSFQGPNLLGLSNLETDLASLHTQLQSNCPRPERDLLLGVMDQWQQAIRCEVEALLGGGPLS